MTQLLEVQKAALKAARGKQGFAYWLEMGLGKTLTALTEFTELVEAGKQVTRLVVVCPNSFKSGWLDEIKKQGVQVDPWVFESGGDNNRFLTKSFTLPPVLIVNYEAIRRPNTQAFIRRFITGRNAMIVFDESIQLKNNRAEQTKAAIMLAREFKVRRILSGKPMTQGPHDLWGQMRSIGQLNNMNFWAFRNTFCRMGGYLNKKVIGAQNEEALGNMIDPHVFRATKDQWIDLPPKHIKLAQIQFGFLIDENEKIHELVEPSQNPRVNAIKEMLDEEITGKLVVVYHHKYAGKVLLEQLADYNPTYIRGGMTAEEINDNRIRFNQHPACRVICIQTTAGRYGHTLVGGKDPLNHCSTMIFAENTWSLDTRSQLEDRIHRIGQEGESCLYVDMVGSSLDRMIVRALQLKQSVFDSVMAHIKS
jgi:SNF2 family DNA or RNA helicase